MISFVADEGELQGLERDCEAAVGAERAARLTTLGWHLRQRDTRRALQLVQDAQALVDAQAPAERNPFDALRRELVRGEAQWLFAEFEQAQTTVTAALASAQSLGDERALADAHWLQASLLYEFGDTAGRDAALAACMQAADRADDAQRATMVRAAKARWQVMRDPEAAQQAWSAQFPDDGRSWPPGVATWVHDFLSGIAFERRDFERAAAHRLRMQDDALATGQYQRAIIARTNLGASFGNLNDYETALEWMQRGLELSRQCGWPMSIASSLLQTAAVLRLLGRLDAAQELLLEARATPGLAPGSRYMAMILQYLGEVFEERKEHAQALATFTELEERTRALSQRDLLMDALRGRAAALAALGRPKEALPLALQALQLCGEHGGGGSSMEALLLLGRLYAEHELPMTEPTQAATPALHYLQQALKTAQSIEGYNVSANLYEALAREYARTGNHDQAYAMMLEASQARERTMTVTAVNRSIAMQVSHQTERARAEAEHHRELAATLQQTTVTLERLSAIGQEITQHLDAASVFEALHKHVDGLLDVTHFSIYLLDEAAGELRFAFGIEDGKPVPPTRVRLDDPKSNVARSARERVEIVRHRAPEGVNPNHIPGTLRSQSALFAPLAIGERLLGVMTIQSPREQVYGERERLIFRTLCAYGAIALDNARAYRQLEATLTELRHAQAELVEKNRLLEDAYRQQEQASLTDPLTQLRNRRFLVQHIESEAALTLRRRRQRQRRGGAGAKPHDLDLVFFMIDVDHFKAINDEHGHAAGDLVLVQMAERLRQVARESDYLIRWGGEEFLLVARATDATEASALAERIRHAVGERAFDIGQGRPLRKTCSVGFACFPFFPTDTKAATWPQTVELADQALYIAKAEGRNRWVGFYGGDDGPVAGVYARIARSPQEAVERGELKLVRGPGMAAAPAAP
jgi:diguanylate cyclase (GGDEF)-like protein